MTPISQTPAVAPLNLTVDVVEFRATADGSFQTQGETVSDGDGVCYCCCCCCCGVDSSVQAEAGA